MILGKIIDQQNNDLSKRIDKQKVPEHVAIIMDGNGRWATKKVSRVHMAIREELVF